ncbi:helix-turn-helix domain-containing protein [Brevibacterium casei]|uniref:Helix-turn-helix domain-containing protein n=1 Tax=Brevibacterium casei TaxID=33889 RepID=A0A7T2WMC1_9MICO|nr:helix-turn-helix domain-containing protein [Brevibacterium casei]
MQSDIETKTPAGVALPHILEEHALAETETAGVQPAVMNEREAAAYVGLTTSWLRNNRRSPQAPPYCKLGGRVRYRIESLDLWLAQQEVKN